MAKTKAHTNYKPAERNLGHYQRMQCVKNRGKANEYLCAKCDRKAKDWAHIHGESGDDPWADFVPLCRRCHMQYDGHNQKGGNSSEARSERMKAITTNNWNDPEYRQHMSDAHYGQEISTETRAKISAALKGKPWSEARRKAQK